MKANTDQADKIHDYYIKLEEIIQRKFIQEYQLKLEQQSIELEEKTVIEQKLHQQLEEKDKLLIHYQQQTYEEVEKVGIVYNNTCDVPNAFKVEFSMNPDRKKALQTACVNEIHVIHEQRTGDPRLVETVIHKVLDRYRCNSYREFFRMDPNHLRRITKLVGHTIDTLLSCFPGITGVEMLDRLNEKLIDVANDTDKSLDELFSDTASIPQSSLRLLQPQIIQKVRAQNDPYIEWISEWIDFSPGSNKQIGLHSVSIFNVCKKFYEKNHYKLVVEKQALYASINKTFEHSRYEKKILDLKPYRDDSYGDESYSRGWSGLKWLKFL